jgi:hypothetical protein
MHKYSFRLSEGRAYLCAGESTPSDRALFCIEDAKNGTLVLAGKQFALSGGGVILCASELNNGIHVPTFFVEGRRFEGPPISVGAGYLCFLPPTHEMLSRIEAELASLKEAYTLLATRLSAVEALIQDTNIF